MAIVTNELIQSLFTAWKGDFQNGLSKAELQHTKIATIAPSTSRSTTYGWLGNFPAMQKWIGDRVLKSMKEHGYQLTNDDYEGTVVVPRNAIADDEVGVYSMMFEEMGNSAANLPDELVFDALTKGFTTPCYDGQNFFDNDHPVYKEVDGSGGVVSVSNVLQEPNYTGQPWYVLDCSRVIKPLIFQDRQKPNLIIMGDEKDESLFMRKELRFGVDSRCVAGYSFWQLAYAVKAPLNSDNIWRAIENMRAILGDGDKKLGIKPTHLVVPTSLEQAATKALKRGLTVEQGASVDNELQDRLELVVADYLS